MSKRKPTTNAETAEGQLAGEAILEVVENQISGNNPREVAATLHRLQGEGLSRDESIRLIANALIVELFDILKHRKPFNEQRYIQNLSRLPELPFDDRDDI